VPLHAQQEFTLRGDQHAAGIRPPKQTGLAQKRRDVFLRRLMARSMQHLDHFQQLGPQLDKPASRLIAQSSEKPARDFSVKRRFVCSQG
jgi:hypothetical protein